MRCQACNKNLSDAESTRRDANGFVDLCNHCYSPHAEDFNDEDDISPILEEDDMEGTDYSGCSNTFENDGET